MIRGIVKSVVKGVIQRISATIWGDGSLDDREFFQHYGYTSRPKPGAEVIFIRQGNAIVAIASDDRRYRLEIEEGEVALYSDEGDKIHLKRGRIIEIIGGEKITASTKIAEVNATTSATVTSPTVTVVASTKVTLQTPLAEVTGDVTVGGTIDVTGAANFGNTLVAAGALSSATSIADPTGTMQGMRQIYNGHTHPENGTGGGTTSTPTQGM